MTNPNNPKPPPKVFISYSHDSRRQKNRVKRFADRLRTDGVDCLIDQYEVSPPEGWPEWCDSQIEKANFVLVVCTEGYFRKVKREEPFGRGRGTKWEGSIIRSILYDSELLNKKIIPIIFSESDAEYIPRPLRVTTHYHLYRNYQLLFRYLTDQLEDIKPPLGPLRSLPPRKRRQTTFYVHDQVKSKVAVRDERHTVDTRQSRRMDPYLLSNSLDRNDQAYDFRTEIDCHHRLSPQRPLVCIIHGDEKECHPEFMIRIKQCLLPEVFPVLNLGPAEDLASERCSMKLPLAALDQENHKELLWKELRKAFNFHGGQSQEDVKGLITGKKSAVMIEVPLETKHWQGVDLAKLNWFFRFWNEDWQDLPENFLLLVCLCCEYTKERTRERRSSDPNSDMRMYLKALDANKYPGVHVARIEELTPIEHRDAREIVNDSNVTLFFDFKFGDIDKIYRESGLCVAPGFMHMLDLLDQLGKFRRTMANSSR